MTDTYNDYLSTHYDVEYSDADREEDREEAEKEAFLDMMTTEFGYDSSVSISNQVGTILNNMDFKYPNDSGLAHYTKRVLTNMVNKEIEGLKDSLSYIEKW